MAEKQTEIITIDQREKEKKAGLIEEKTKVLLEEIKQDTQKHSKKNHRILLFLFLGAFCGLIILIYNFPPFTQ